MSVDLYIYNGSTQFYDTTASINDLVLQRQKLIPPGCQGHLVVADAPTAAAVSALHENYGVVNTPSAVLAASAATTKAHAPTPIQVGKTQPKIV